MIQVTCKSFEQHTSLPYFDLQVSFRGNFPPIEVNEQALSDTVVDSPQIQEEVKTSEEGKQEKAEENETEKDQLQDPVEENEQRQESKEETREKKWMEQNKTNKVKKKKWNKDKTKWRKQQKK